jgi:two-component system response regulator DevR
MRSKVDPIRVLLVDDHEVVRSGLRAILGRFPRIRVVGEADSESEALSKAQKLYPDVILLDLHLKTGSGIAVCRAVKASLPDTKVLVLTAFADKDYVLESVVAGADGYILKEIDSKSLYEAIVGVKGGKPILDAMAVARLVGHVREDAGQLSRKAALLSTQERRLVARIAEGKTNKEIGRFMTLSEKTVKNYLSNIFEKLSVSRRSQLAALYSQYPHWFAESDVSTRS